MKPLFKVLFVLIAFSLVFSFNTGLYAEKSNAGEKKSDKSVKECTEGVFYYCPMKQCDYKTDKPGKCPKCGMELKKHEPKVVYVCPMKQCNVQTDKPGKCPKCGMELKKKFLCCAAEGEEHKCKHQHEHKHEHKHEHAQGHEHKH